MKRLVIFAAALAAFTPSAHAEVKATGENGFNVVQKAVVSASPDEIWKRLISPKDWWNKAHSWSGSTEGFYLDAQANGCFCEIFQEKQKDGKLKTTGSVEHMRVIFAQPGKVLRMQGAIGPLQAEAVNGTLTVAIEPVKDDANSSVLSFSYVVGGYMRYKVGEIAPAIDKVFAEQFAGLIKPFVKAEPAEPKGFGWSLDLDGLPKDSPTSGADDEPVAVPEDFQDGEALPLKKAAATPAKPAKAPAATPAAKAKLIKEGAPEPR